MTGRVTDAQEDGFIFHSRLGESLVIPCEPIHGIVRVLQKVGRFFLRKTVCMFRGHGDRINRILQNKKRHFFAVSVNRVFQF